MVGSGQVGLGGWVGWSGRVGSGGRVRSGGWVGSGQVGWVGLHKLKFQVSLKSDIFKLSYDELNMMSSGGSGIGDRGEGELKDQPRLIKKTIEFFLCQLLLIPA